MNGCSVMDDERERERRRAMYEALESGVIPVGYRAVLSEEEKRHRWLSAKNYGNVRPPIQPVPTEGTQSLLTVEPAPPPRATGKVPAPSGSPPKMLTCEVCGRYATSHGDLRRHLRKGHPNHSSVPELLHRNGRTRGPAPVPPATRAQPDLGKDDEPRARPRRCPLCRHPISQANLKRHKRKHPTSEAGDGASRALGASVDPPKASRTAGSLTTPLPSASENRRRSFLPAKPEDETDEGSDAYDRDGWVDSFDRIDGSQDGRMYRDHGEFGSHPSHDPHGEESGPD
jgi:hypothetical protein